MTKNIAETSAKQKIKIINVLIKRKMKVIKELKKCILVVFTEKNKTKLGWISKMYYHRYGIDVFLTMEKNNIIPWIRSKTDMVHLNEELLTKIRSNDFSDYKDFTTDMLNSIDW